ncbi:hypothetical protein NQ314_017435, partial [Rhamnusium bicolor]
ALECGIGRVDSDFLKETLSTCVKNNETLEKIWEMASAIPSPDSMQDSDSSSSESEKPLTQNSRRTRGSRIKRATTNVQSKTIQVNERRQNEAKLNQSTGDSEENGRTEDTTTSGPESSETCIVQCVFDYLDMTDDNGFPQQSKFLERLLKSATGRELRIFMQESADECFQKMDKENNSDPCSYSTQLVTCFANKGRLNCEDWPAGNLPF